MKTEIWIRFPSTLVLSGILTLVFFVAGVNSAYADNTIFIDNTIPAYYNADLGTVLDGTDLERFPLANTHGGTFIFTSAPDLSIAESLLGD